MTDELTEKEMTPEQATAIVTGYNELGKKIAEAGIPAAAKPAEEDKPTEETQTDEKPAMESEDDDATTEQKMVMRPTQAEVSYVTLSTKKGAACANCRWFSANGHMGNEGAYCHLIDNWPDDILPTGYCERHEAKPDMTMPEQPPIPVVIVEAELKAIKDYKSVVQRIKKTIDKAFNPNAFDNDSSFIVYKSTDGKPRWFARPTNNFEDLAGDVFTEKAHDKYIARFDAGLVPPPKLTFWHLQGTAHGTATKVMRDGHIVMAWGTFDDTPLTDYFMKYYSKNKGQMQLSLGAYVPEWARTTDPDIRGRLFTDYNAMHITTLPPRIARAANPFTTFSEDITMALESVQKEFMVKDMGIPVELVELIERNNATINEKIGELVKYKDFADLITKSDDKPATVTDKTIATLFADLIGDQALVVKIAEGVAKHQETVDAELKALKDTHAVELKAATDAIIVLKADAEAFRAFMNLTPRRASSDDKTALTPEQAAEVKKDIPTDVDPFWASLGVPKEA
jgi:hypothetical protein